MPNTLTLLLLASNGPSIDDIRRFVGDRNGASYAVAEMIMKVVDWILGIFGLDHNQTVVTFLYAAVVLCVALVVGRITQWIVLHLVREITKHWSSDMYEALKSVNFFHKICRIIPALVFLVLIEFALSNHTALSTTLSKLTLIYVVFVTAVALSAVIVAVWQHIDRRANKRKLPLTGLAQLAKGIVWIVAAIVIICILIDQSPGRLLAGLGAFAAVLMLVFKDSILGLVAGLQLSQNDMLHVGDWIVVPSTIANGIVTDVSLTAVKVRNWDNTIVTLPPYTLISGSFQNWRGMSQSGVRQIARSILVDLYTVTKATPEFVDRIVEEFPVLKPYVGRLRASSGMVFDPGMAAVNGTIETNLGLYRAYLCEWLLSHPSISSSNQILVRLMAPTEYGIPLQIWCFTSTTAWTAYEAIQSALFEHIAVTAPAFGLRLFNDTSGSDILTVDTVQHHQSPAPSPSSSSSSSAEVRSTPPEDQEAGRQTLK